MVLGPQTPHRTAVGLHAFGASENFILAFAQQKIPGFDTIGPQKVGVDVQHDFTLAVGLGVEPAAFKPLPGQYIDQPFIMIGQYPQVHILHGPQPDIRIGLM